MVSPSARIAVIVLSGIVVAGLGVLGVFQYQADQTAREAATRPESLKVEAPVVPVQAAQKPEAPKKEIWVHVTGAVQKPGVYQLPEGARVAEALNAAGGPLPDGRPDELNLAEVLTDGAKVWIPTEADLKPAVEAPSAPPVVAKGTVQPVRSTVGASAEATVPKAGGKVNLNTATVKELDSLEGIGPALAAKIIDYREANGPFKSVSDLKKVKGIGDSILEKNRDRLTI